MALDAPVARAATVTTGASTATTASEGAWGATFVQPRGTALRTVGPIAFRTAAGWQRTTRIASRRGAAAVLATTDPARRTVTVRIARDARGVIALRAAVSAPAGVRAVRIALRGHRGERYLGFGERSDAVGRRRGTVENRVAEGPFQPDERPLVEAFVPRPGLSFRRDASSFPIPWLLSTAGYGVLVDEDETSAFHLRGGGRWAVRAAAPRLRLRVFAGPRPADVLRRMTARTGRQPPSAPYFFGPWYQPKGDEAGELRRLLDAGVPLSLAQTYTHYLPCGDQRGREAAERRRVRRFHAAGLAVTTYFNPMVCTRYAEAFAPAVAAGALTRTLAGAPYVYEYLGSTVFEVGQYDFTGPAGRRSYRGQLRQALRDGFDGWMEDFGEYTPFDARGADGSTGSAGHNRYPQRFHCAAHAATRGRRLPVARYVRSGWTGTARCAPVVWGGDPTTSWGYDGLSSAVANGLTMGLSGVSRWGSDIGGYFALGDDRLTPELLIRWIQFGAVSGVMRTQANGTAIPRKVRPQLTDAMILPQWRRWARLRTQLYPYLQAADDEYRATGLPVMRHLALAFPEDRRAVAQDDEYLFGPDLLAAPVTTPGARRRSLYLPRGRWIDVWRSVALAADGGLRLRRVRSLAGGRRTSLPAPLAELPLLARAGAVLPLLPADVGTLSPYGGDRHQRRLGRRTRLHLLAFPRGRSRARLPRGGRIDSRETRAGWTLTVRARPRRAVRLQAGLETLRRPFAPCAVEVDGRPLGRGRWSYRAADRVLVAEPPAAFRGLAVRRCDRPNVRSVRRSR